MPYFSEEVGKVKLDDLLACDALLMGRVTYQIHASSWPMIGDEDAFAARINRLPKYVVSTTLETVEWNNTRLIKSNIIEGIKKLKGEIARDILMDGGSDLVNTLAQHGLINEYRLLLYPVVVGRGKRLFAEGSQKQGLKLIEARTLSSGVVALTYQPASSLVS